jgi:uncharacterized protein
MPITAPDLALTMNDQFVQFLARAELFMARVEASLPQGLELPDWSASIAFRYRRRNTGRGVISAVRHIGAMALDDLKEIDQQKEKIQRNTAQFVGGLPANNVLLTGARGTGKSSLIRACLHTYAPQGLRLIEVDKADLVDLPDIVEAVAPRPEKFIVFCDDLSFDDGEPGYKALNRFWMVRWRLLRPMCSFTPPAIDGTCCQNTCRRT